MRFVRGSSSPAWPGHELRGAGDLPLPDAVRHRLRSYRQLSRLRAVGRRHGRRSAIGDDVAQHRRADGRPAGAAAPRSRPSRSARCSAGNASKVSGAPIVIVDRAGAACCCLAAKRTDQQHTHSSNLREHQPRSARTRARTCSRRRWQVCVGRCGVRRHWRRTARSMRGNRGWRSRAGSPRPRG